jgi:ribosome-associated translation inhibitor RaiA
MEPSPALEQFAQRWAAKLANIYDRIARGEVLIERPHQRQHQGQRIHVRVTLSVPGPDIVVSHDPSLDGAHEDAYVAVRDAFRSARRQLVEHVQRERGSDLELSALDQEPTHP